MFYIYEIVLHITVLLMDDHHSSNNMLYLVNPTIVNQNFIILKVRYILTSPIYEYDAIRSIFFSDMNHIIIIICIFYSSYIPSYTLFFVYFILCFIFLLFVLFFYSSYTFISIIIILKLSLSLFLVFFFFNKLN